MLDNIIDVNTFPNKIYENYQKNMRTIGLGYTGLADMLAMLGMKYNSNKAVEYVDNLMEMCTNAAYMASIDLAKERGPFAFCNPQKHAYNLFTRKNLTKDIQNKIAMYGIRNAKINSVAPTGTLSMAFGNNCSSGIEPIFSLSYQRKAKIGGQDEKNAKMIEVQDYAYWLYNHLVEEGVCVDYNPEDIFVTALEMTVDEHINMLAAISKHIDMSVSKTINVPTEYSFEDTKDIYMKCWENDIKGCTIFRPNELRQGILFTENKEKENPKSTKIDGESHTYSRGEWKQIASDTIYYKRKIKIGCGKLSLFIGWSPSEHCIQELWVQRTGQGGCEKSIQSTVITMSGMLRLGGNIFNIEKALEGLGPCNSFVGQRAKGNKLSKGSSCATAILNEIKKFLEEIDGQQVTPPNPIQKEEVEKIISNVNISEKNTQANVSTYDMDRCPECGEPLQHIGGCVQCSQCSWSRCG